MNFTCNECNDSGSRDKLGTYLDCNACGTASMRRDLNDFVKSLGPTHPEDVALAIHQRALAMAPKQKFNCDFRAVGAMFIGNGGTNPVAYVQGGMRVDLSGWTCTAPGAAPAAANGALTDEQVVCALGCIANGRNAGHISTENAKVVREFIRAAAGPDAALVALIHKAQSILARHLPPGGPDAKTTISALIYLLDGPESRAALSGAKGN